ncbi:MAG: hypothetical protein AAF927_14320 [Bacteroidota bacterium]
MKTYFLSLFLLSLAFSSWGQSLELMLGNERLFADVQWLKFIDADAQWSLFSRTRATLNETNQTDLFSGAYLNRTFSNGLGVSLIGKIGANGGGADLGVHIFKAKPHWMLFALASVGLKDEWEYSWFSILRITPPLNEKWKLYSSLELFNLFNQGKHLISVQRLRLGLDNHQIQFGAALNLSEVGADWTTSSNLGAFIRKSF